MWDKLRMAIIAKLNSVNIVLEVKLEWRELAVNIVSKKVAIWRVFCKTPSSQHFIYLTDWVILSIAQYVEFLWWVSILTN